MALCHQDFLFRERRMLFFKIFLAVFIAEMGDKTQLMLVAMASKYRIRDIVLGTLAAILLLNGIAVLLGGLASRLIPPFLIKFIAAFAFLYFAATALERDEEEEESRESRVGFAPLAVLVTFFVAELGDKTQLTAITFGANEGLDAAPVVWLACSAGLFAADIIGIAIGYLLKSRLPERFLKLLSFIIFALFGLTSLPVAVRMAAGDETMLVISVEVIAIVLFSLSCLLVLRHSRKEK